MTSTRNAVINAVKTAVLTVDGLTPERVHVGAFNVGLVSGGMHVALRPLGNRGERIDGGQTRRTLRVAVAVISRLIPGSTTRPDEQAAEFYELVHAKLETLRDGLASPAIVQVEEDGDGIAEPDILVGTGENSAVQILVVGCNWTITYDRPLGSP